MKMSSDQSGDETEQEWESREYSTGIDDHSDIAEVVDRVESDLTEVWNAENIVNVKIEITELARYDRK